MNQVIVCFSMCAFLPLCVLTELFHQITFCKSTITKKVKKLLNYPLKYKLCLARNLSVILNYIHVSRQKGYIKIN